MVYFILFFFCISSLYGDPLQSSTHPEKIAEEKLKSMITVSKKNTVGHIILNDATAPIDASSWLYMKRAFDHYKKTKPIAILLELNTPGGEVFIAQKMANALKEMDIQYNIPIIAYINTWAISAGAMLAYSCRFIAIAKDATMGAAQPIFLGPSGEPSPVGEKIVSALRTEFANRAQFFGRNPFLAEAMVDTDTIIVLRAGKIKKLDNMDEIQKTEDIIINPKGKLLTLRGEELLKLGVADFYIPPGTEKPLTDTEESSGHWPLKKSCLEAVPFFRDLPNTKIESYRMSWQEELLFLLAKPSVSSLLFLCMSLAFYMEITTGGFGIAGTVGVVSLYLLLLSTFSLDAIQWLEPLLFVLGLILVAVDLLAFGGGAFLAIVGGILMVFSFAAMLIPNIPSFTEAPSVIVSEFLLHRLAWLAGSFIAACAIIFILSRYIWPKVPLMKKLILEEKCLGITEKTSEPVWLDKKVPPGTEGTVIAALRPAGKILIGDTEYDALSSGGYIAEGETVIVTDQENPKIVVEPKKQL